MRELKNEMENVLKEYEMKLKHKDDNYDQVANSMAEYKQLMAKSV